MYVVLTGAKKNLGDFLITARAEALLRAMRPEHELVRLPGWEPLDGHLDLLKKAAAVIILGGPGYQPTFHGGVYQLTKEVADLPCPLVPLGLGWKGIPGDQISLDTYRFNERSMRALEFAEKNPAGLSARCHLTVAALKNAGLSKVTMTGCPVWYDLPSIGKPMRLPTEVKRLVFTPAQDPMFAEQSIRSAEVLAKIFPHAEKICSFHRGLKEVDQWTPSRDIDVATMISSGVRAFGFESRDVSGDLEKASFYDDSDFHVGYRVHAHIHFLSRRLPSILLHEDGRGIGQSHALDLSGLTAFRRTKLGRIAHRLPSPIERRLRKADVKSYEADPLFPSRLDEMVRQDVASGFSRFAGTGAVIDRHLEVMKAFLAKLP